MVHEIRCAHRGARKAPPCPGNSGPGLARHTPTPRGRPGPPILPPSPRNPWRLVLQARRRRLRIRRGASGGPSMRCPCLPCSHSFLLKLQKLRAPLKNPQLSPRSPRGVAIIDNVRIQCQEQGAGQRRGVVQVAVADRLLAVSAYHDMGAVRVGVDRVRHAL